MKYCNIFTSLCLDMEISTFCFILCLVGIVLATIIVIILVVYIYKYLKDNLVVRKSKIHMEAEIIKMLGGLVRADEQDRRRDDTKDDKGRSYVYRREGKAYVLKIENSEINTDNPGGRNEMKK